tara:strand:- start:126 stop:1037 length:912 start_codon:yes stop_codon:yes gene_type:complete
MTRFPTNYIILEGPDLSGKTTFYNSLHKDSSYKWNIQDRSYLSMLVHAAQYERDTKHHEYGMSREILNLNNRFVILLPDFQDVILRYSMRGDEIQSLEDIKGLYKDFENHANRLCHFPNVTVLRGSELDYNVSLVKNEIEAIENGNLDLIADFVKTFAANSPSHEATPLSMTLYDDGTFEDVDPSVMDYEHEKDYYKKIYSSMITKIRRELRGENEYNRVEPVTSRRFIYTDDTCISLIHASYRGSTLDMHFVLRSSEVAKTFRYDLNFLYFLTNAVYKELNLIPKEVDVRMRFNLNSAHILV